MEFVELTGDCTDFVVQPNTFHLIPHNLNTDGVWGSGVVVPIFTKWGVAARAYENWHANQDGRYSPKCLPTNNADFQLGNIQVVNVEKGILVVNMLAQKSMGSQFGMPSGRYEALQECLLKIRVCCDKINDIGKNVVIESPKFGAVRSGLDWTKIFDMVQSIFKDTTGIWNTYTYEGPHA